MKPRPSDILFFESLGIEFYEPLFENSASKIHSYEYDKTFVARTNKICSEFFVEICEKCLLLIEIIKFT